MEQRDEQKQKQALIFRASIIIAILCLLMTCAICGIIARYEITRIDDSDVSFEVIDDNISGKDDDDKPSKPSGEDDQPGGDDQSGVGEEPKPSKPGKPTGGGEKPKPDKPVEPEVPVVVPEEPEPEAPTPEPPEEPEPGGGITIIIPPSGPSGPPDMSAEFDLFDTVEEADGESKEENVKTGKLIAPGTGGSFDVKISNLSSDTIEYVLRFEEVNDNGVFVQYSLDGNAWYDNLEDMDMDDLCGYASRGENLTEVVYWRWVYDAAQDTTAHAGQNDVTDTALGIMGQTKAPQVIIKAELYAWYR